MSPSIRRFASTDRPERKGGRRNRARGSPPLRPSPASSPSRSASVTEMVETAALKPPADGAVGLMPATSFDAILVVAFGGPEGIDDVMPFLENVTRGRNVSR